MHSIFLHYSIPVPNTQVSDSPYSVFQDQQYYYFVIPTRLQEQTFLEQYTIAKHFHQYQWENVLLPVQNVHNQWITQIGQDKYVLWYAKKGNDAPFSGSILAQFHQTGFPYPYQPRTSNSYGKWKELWIQKLEQYEQMYQTLYQKRPVSRFIRHYVDMFPYLVGLSENAIQYLNIVEAESRFNESDQGTFTFGRYHLSMQNDFIYMHQLVYDHPVRDIAEGLRYFLLQKDGITKVECKKFIEQYVSIQPLSIFSWKLLYARLLFPIHLFDIVDKFSQQDGGEEIIEEIIVSQSYYEANLRDFYYEMGVDEREANIIQLDWLY
ncbi:hypothetical protein [Gracilibacillus sp. YIM 98692]|uniref:hypothetical protein n=1 Tax=Gracilibacillus sp. YIM 98692 TaxID=2663532 RepID=UPI0013D1613F|nr:hypothetical protein [Gracilibacillus sp. YIM 98692]